MLRDVIQFVQTRALWIVLGILMFTVASSKQIIIYNEEILVALNFFAFVWFTSHYYGQQIQDALDQRSREVAQGLQNYVEARVELVSLCKQEYTKQINFEAQIKSLAAFSQHEILEAAKNSQARLTRVIPTLVAPKLEYLAQTQQSVQQDVQRQVALYLCNRVLETYRSAPSIVRNTLIAQSIRRLQNPQI